MKLSDLIRRVTVLEAQGPLDVEIDRVTRDSREVRPGALFVAVVGARVDGHDLVEGLGASAVVVQRQVTAPEGVTVLRVADSKLALAQLSAALWGHPGESVQVVGVTGTNGKTTVTTLVEGALASLGRRVARIGTTGNAVDGVARPTAFTTPEAPQLQRFLADLRDEGVPLCLMEVSSIGLAQRRVDGIPFALGVFTNLSQDHLDFHGEMADYREAKARLFRELLRPAGGPPRALLWGDEPTWRQMDPPEDRWLYGFGEGCDLRIQSSQSVFVGTRLRLETPLGPAAIRSEAIGRHNALNLTAALGICLLLGFGLEESAEAVGRAPGAPGRLERIHDPGKRLILVDYAHTPDALGHALRTVREVARGRVWVVFGCGGDRDAGKRPQMGEVASKLADVVILTSDNPRHEDPSAIIEAIAAGAGPTARIEPDRAQAITAAIQGAAPGDVVLIAGKGHETYQEIGDTRVPFDDREVARAVVGAA